MDWKVIAPKREDWERLTAAWAAAGLGVIPWRNGEPVFPEGIDMARVQEIVTPGADSQATQTRKESVAPTVTPEPVQKPKGWPKGKKRNKR